MSSILDPLLVQAAQSVVGPLTVPHDGVPGWIEWSPAVRDEYERLARLSHFDMVRIQAAIRKTVRLWS